MLDAETLKLVATLGVGGVLAWGMFSVYRKDSLAWQSAWKGQSEMLVQVVKENTAAITALVTKLDQRVGDLSDMRGRRRGDPE